jgi:hypothetical protein
MSGRKISAAIAEAEEAVEVAGFKRRFYAEAIPTFKKHEQLLRERLTLEQVLALQDEAQDYIDLFMAGLGPVEAEKWVARLVVQDREGWRKYLELRRGNRERAQEHLGRRRAEKRSW